MDFISIGLIAIASIVPFSYLFFGLPTNVPNSPLSKMKPLKSDEKAFRSLLL